MADETFHDTDVSVVIAPKELLVGNREAFKKYLLGQANGRHLLVDLKLCDFIDSSALGMLLTVSRELRRSGKNLGLIGHNEDFRTLFELTRIDQLVFVSSKPKANLKALSGLRAFEPVERNPDDEEGRFPGLKLI